MSDQSDIGRLDMLRVFVAGGRLTITVGVDFLAEMIVTSPCWCVFHPKTDQETHPRVVDADRFAQDVLNELLYRDEDDRGRTPVEVMLEVAGDAAIQHGTEGINIDDRVVRQDWTDPLDGVI